VGRFLRDQAKTQGLNITEQLNSGMRFVDFRLVWSKGPQKFTPYDWYSLHLVQTNQKALVYFQEIRTWLDSHPNEIVVMMLTRHGNTCLNNTDQYPGTTPEIRQSFWKSVESVFQGMLFDTSVSRANETSVSSLLARGHRVVMYAADWANFTNSSPLAYDSCLFLENVAFPESTGVTNETFNQPGEI
jgi:hypothetical protein